MEQVDGEVTVAIELASKLFVDIRQQVPATAENTINKIYGLIKKIQEENPNKSNNEGIRFKIRDKGNPVQTTPELVKELEAICNENDIPCIIMNSCAGHDIACNLSEENKSAKRILFFIPSTGGSHNKNENTTREAIEMGSKLYSIFISKNISREYALIEQGEDR